MQKTEDKKCIENKISLLENNYKRAQKNLTLKKYQQIKVAVKELCYGCKRDDRFPSIRRICKEIETGPVPVQRAIAELIAEDVLYAKSGIGLFIKNPPVRNPINFSGHHSMRKVGDLNFLYYDKSNANRKLILQIVDKMRKTDFKMASVRLIFEPDNAITPDIAVQFDSTNSFLNMADFASHDINKGNIHIEGKYGVILSHITYYLFYNKKMLEKLGIDKPSYTTFAEQKEYIRKAKRIIEQKGSLSPFSWNGAHCLLGKRTMELLKFLKGNEDIDSKTGQRLLNVLSDLMDYYKLFVYDSSSVDAEKSAFWHFLNSKTPLFAGCTNCLEQLEQLRGTNLDWEAYPVLACDNTLPLEPVYATIDAQTRLPMECTNFMICLQKEEWQNSFYNHGYITVQRNGKYLSGHPALIKAAKESFSGYLEESVDNYLFEHILSFELVSCGIKGKDIKETFENIFYYSRAYIRNFKLIGNSNE